MPPGTDGATNLICVSEIRTNGGELGSVAHWKLVGGVESTSVAEHVRVTLVPGVSGWGGAVMVSCGGSLTGVRLTETVAVADVRDPSDNRSPNESCPMKFNRGV